MVVGVAAGPMRYYDNDEEASPSAPSVIMAAAARWRWRQLARTRELPEVSPVGRQSSPTGKVKVTDERVRVENRSVGFTKVFFNFSLHETGFLHAAEYCTEIIVYKYLTI